MRPIRFKAREKKTGKPIEGFYARLHMAESDNDEATVTVYTEHDAIFNDEPGMRSTDGSFWHEIDGNTLCQRTGMTDMFMMPIWEHDIVRLYPVGETTRPHDSDTEQGTQPQDITGEVVFLQTAYCLQLDDGRQWNIADIRRRWDIQIIGNRYNI